MACFFRQWEDTWMVNAYRFRSRSFGVPVLAGKKFLKKTRFLFAMIY